jgi:hypothetical protein
MSNNAAPAVDAEMQQFQDDLLLSIREFKSSELVKAILHHLMAKES